MSYSTLNRLPDVINASPKNHNFTIINNDILRNPLLSLKAKGLLCLLLSNSEGWTSYETVIQSLSTDGRDSIRSGLLELEKTGYLWRITYVDSTLKTAMGSFWVYSNTPRSFDIERELEWMGNKGYEIWAGSKRYTDINPETGKPVTANRPLRSTKEKEEKIKDLNTIVPPLKSNNTNRPIRPTRPEPPKVDLDLPFKAIAASLHKIMITHYPNHITTEKQVSAWVKPIKAMFTKTYAGTPEQVVSWLEIYNNTFIRGSKYHPVIMSAESLVAKIDKLENFVNPKTDSNQSNKRPAMQNFEPVDKSVWKNHDKITINLGE